MTTLVFDGQILASDGQMSSCNMVASLDYPKIFLAPEGTTYKGEHVIAYGIAGDCTGVDIIHEWIGAGLDTIPDFKKDHEDFQFEIIMVTSEACYEFCTTYFGWCKVKTSTMGSGGDFAASALVLRKNAVEAVKHAAMMDVFTGGVIRYISCHCEQPRIHTVRSVV